MGASEYCWLRLNMAWKFIQDDIAGKADAGPEWQV